MGIGTLDTILRMGNFMRAMTGVFDIWPFARVVKEGKSNSCELRGLGWRRGVGLQYARCRLGIWSEPGCNSNLDIFIC